MRALIQRVSEGGVIVKSENYSQSISRGMMILLGVKQGDTEADAEYVADKCTNLRIFEDEEGKMNLSVKDINGEVLIISQFTLYADTHKGNRPGFSMAARPESANFLYEKFVARFVDNLGSDKIKTGIFGSMMDVKITNEGPVTLLVESRE